MKVSQKQPRGRFVRGCGAASFARSPWGDIDFADGYLRVRIGAGKAAREDVIPLHEQVLEALTEARSADAKPTDHVLRTMPTIRTFYFYLERARTALMPLENGERQSLLTARALNPARLNVCVRSLRVTARTMPCLKPSTCNLLAMHSVAQ